MKPKTPKAAKPAKAVEPSVTDKQTEILWNLAAVVNDVAQVVKKLAAAVKELKGVRNADELTAVLGSGEPDPVESAAHPV